MPKASRTRPAIARRTVRRPPHRSSASREAQVGKSERPDTPTQRSQRERILGAARQLIQEQSTMQISMRVVAARARVSLETTYQLFGSRRGLINAIYLAEGARYQECLKSLRPENALELEFERIRLIAEFCAERSIERAYFREVENWPDDQTAGVLRKAIEEGHIRGEVDVQLLSEHLTSGYLHALREWASGMLELGLLQPRLEYGLTVTLAGVATPKTREALDARIARLQARYRGELAKQNSASEFARESRQRPSSSGRHRAAEREG